MVNGIYSKSIRHYKFVYVIALIALTAFFVCACQSPADAVAVTDIPEPETVAAYPTEPYCEPTTPPTEEETTPQVDLYELEMLATVIYQEAGSDSICSECRYRVGDIVLNRVADDRFPDTMYGVLTQKGQYGKFSSTGIVWPSRASNPNEKHAVERAYAVAEYILTDAYHSECYGEGYVWQAGFKQGTDGFWCCGHFYGR